MSQLVNNVWISHCKTSDWQTDSQTGCTTSKKKHFFELTDINVIPAQGHQSEEQQVPVQAPLGQNRNNSFIHFSQMATPEGHALLTFAFWSPARAPEAEWSGSWAGRRRSSWCSSRTLAAAPRWRAAPLHKGPSARGSWRLRRWKSSRDQTLVPPALSHTHRWGASALAACCSMTNKTPLPELCMTASGFTGTESFTWKWETHPKPASPRPPTATWATYSVRSTGRSRAGPCLGAASGCPTWSSPEPLYCPLKRRSEEPADEEGNKDKPGLKKSFNINQTSDSSFLLINVHLPRSEGEQEEEEDLFWSNVCVFSQSLTLLLHWSKETSFESHFLLILCSALFILSTGWRCFLSSHVSAGSVKSRPWSAGANQLALSLLLNCDWISTGENLKVLTILDDGLLNCRIICDGEFEVICSWIFSTLDANNQFLLVLLHRLVWTNCFRLTSGFH